MNKRLLGMSRKKMALVPRLAYGCVGAGMSVIPLCVVSTAACSDGPSVGIEPAMAVDAATGVDGATADGATAADGATDDANDEAPSIGIAPAMPDASSEIDAPSIGIRPAMEDAG